MALEQFYIISNEITLDNIDFIWSFRAITKREWIVYIIVIGVSGSLVINLRKIPLFSSVHFTEEHPLI